MSNLFPNKSWLNSNELRREADRIEPLISCCIYEDIFYLCGSAYSVYIDIFFSDDDNRGISPEELGKHFLEKRGQVYQRSAVP